MSFDYEILSQNDLLELFPFGRSNRRQHHIIKLRRFA